MNIGDKVKVAKDKHYSGLDGVTGTIIEVSETAPGFDVYVQLDDTTDPGKKFWFERVELEVVE